MCFEIPKKKHNNDNHYPLYIYVLKQPNDQLQDEHQVKMSTDQDNGKQKKTLRDNITFIKPVTLTERRKYRNYRANW
jgi:hypothetical protein